MKISRRLITLFLAAALLCTTVFSVVAEGIDTSDLPTAEEEKLAADIDNIARSGYAKLSYYEYKKLFSSVPSATQTVEIDGSSYVAASNDVMVYTDADSQLADPSRAGKSVLTGESSDIEWVVNIPETGLYVLNIDYYTVDIQGSSIYKSKGSEIERSMFIDGEQPFTEAAAVTFLRTYVDAEEIQQDVFGHDIRPNSKEVNCWTNADCHDASGVFNEPFNFYLTEGRHIIRFKSIKEPVVINKLKFYTPKKLDSYATALEKYKAAGYKEVDASAVGDAGTLHVQAEHPSKKSSSTLYPTYDRASAAMEPSSFDVIKINEISSAQFRTAYQWIEWNFDVPVAGLYKISTRFKQSDRDGAFCSRKVYVNGEIPYEEAQYVRFFYDSSWQVSKFKDVNGNDLLFKFDKGVNTIKLEVSLGEFADAASRVEQVIFDLNQCYREIVQITGSTPDGFRDYGFRELIPGTLEVLERSLGELKDIKASIEAYTGETGSFLSSFNTLITDLDSMVSKPRTIANRLAGFKTNLGSLSTWELDIASQPISFDWIQIDPVDAKDAKAEANFFVGFGFQFKMFLASFYMDYNDVGLTEKNISSDKSNEIKVWVATGRDQFQIIRRMINNDTSGGLDGVSVNLQLVAAGTLLPSVLAGTGPDISLMVANTDPLNYAIRNAVLDVSQFPNYNEVAKRFNSEAVIPYMYKGKTYALPETFTFNMLFYRTDILAEYGLSVPQTWQDVYDCMVKLSMNGMYFGIMPTAQTYGTLLYQNGGTFYNEDGTASALDSAIAIRAFEQWTGFYTEYTSLVDFDFANRFRTGEMPIGISDYTAYNQMSVFATEIKGLWEFTKLPGVEKTDANGKTYIDRSTAATGTACIILSSTKNKEASWKFLDWWTSTGTQVGYGREIESMQGIAGRYATANEEALSMLAWNVEDYQALKSQWKWAKAVPEYPGSYILGRYLEFAFRNVYNDKVDPGEELIDYVEQINDELTRKQAEFEKDKS